MSDPVFHLAIVDREHTVLLVWPTAAEAHADLADKLAARLEKSGRKRPRVAAEIRAFLLELQIETTPLAAGQLDPPSEP